MTLWDFLNINQIWGLAYLIVSMIGVWFTVAIITRPFVPVAHSEEEEPPMAADELN